MRRIVAVLVPVLLAAVGAAAGAEFSDDFTGATLRADFYHAGTAREEHLALDRVTIEGPWPGSRTQLVDTTGLGKYLVEVVDGATNRTLYTRGFAGIFGEWETTAEALAGTWRVTPEAVRVPEPRRPFQLRVRKRGTDGVFREIQAVPIDPASRDVRRPPVPTGDVRVLLDNGDPATKVDLLILGDGWTAAETDAFLARAHEMTEALFREPPFAEHRADFNVRALVTPSALSGVSRPRAGAFRATPLGTTYDAFGSERYVLTFDDRGWRDRAAAAPYDAVVMLVHERKYGGGGIFNLYATAAADSEFAPYLFVHEFGHSFAGLGDEYFTSPVAYEPSAGTHHDEPWEPNVTAAPSAPKWSDLVTPGTPLPTPWNKEEYESRSRAFQARRAALRDAGAPEEQVEALFREERDAFERMLGDEEHAGEVGAFEGALYESAGLYRPAVDCIMFTRDRVGFCPVCRRAIETVIGLYAR